MKRLALYMFYDPSGVVADYVIYKLQKLSEHVDKIAVICNGFPSPAGRSRLDDVADIVHVRDNKGFDVGAYREGLDNLIGFDNLSIYDEVLLLNYTFYAPIFPFSEMFTKMDAQDIDFWGITAHDGPTPNGFTGIGTIPLHIQSHFIAVRRSMFEKKSFRDYWNNMPPINSYVDSVLQHEARFTETFARQGFRYAIYCEPEKYKVMHAAFDAVDTLVDDRCPILKRRPLYHDPLYLDQNNVELPRALSLVKDRSDYDVDLIWKDITRVAKPRNLYTNAALLEVLDNTGLAPTLRKELRIGVLAHVDGPEGFNDILPFLKNLPIRYDLHITTDNHRKKQALKEKIGDVKEAGFELCGVEVVEARGRDVSALVIGHRDVVLDGSYDYLCRLHGKVHAAVPERMTRYSEDDLYENLLASPTYVGRLLDLFEQEQRLGIVMPPATHLEYAHVENAWFASRPAAETWADTLGIEVPFDDFTPLGAHGTMCWFRPAALKRIFAHPFRWEDFPPEPNRLENGLTQTLERLFVSAAHQQGYYAKCVLTPDIAAKNYVHLEYKLQNMIGRSQYGGGSNEFARFPTWAVKHYLNCRLSPVPRVRTALQKVYRAGRSTYQALLRPWN